MEAKEEKKKKEQSKTSKESLKFLKYCSFYTETKLGGNTPSVFGNTSIPAGGDTPSVFGNTSVPASNTFGFKLTPSSSTSAPVGQSTWAF